LAHDGVNGSVTSWLDAVAASHGDGTTRSSTFLEQTTMAQSYKYQIDVGGISGTSWNGLRWKLCASGSLVLKVDSDTTDWWHGTIAPYVDYIPIRHDLSNLYDTYQFLEEEQQQHQSDNDDDGRNDTMYTISTNGQRHCLATIQNQTYVKLIHRDIIRSLPSIPSQSIHHETKLFFSRYHKSAKEKRQTIRN
jgi:Glycosyl transferase family 90